MTTSKAAPPSAGIGGRAGVTSLVFRRRTVAFLLSVVCLSVTARCGTDRGPSPVVEVSVLCGSSTVRGGWSIALWYGSGSGIKLVQSSGGLCRIDPSSLRRATSLAVGRWTSEVDLPYLSPAVVFDAPLEVVDYRLRLSVPEQLHISAMVETIDGQPPSTGSLALHPILPDGTDADGEAHMALATALATDVTRLIVSPDNEAGITDRKCELETLPAIYSLDLTDGRHVSFVVSSHNRRGVLVFEIPFDGIAAGRVHDESGMPISDVEVEYRYGFDPDSAVASVRPMDGGVFVIPLRSRGPIWIRAIAPSSIPLRLGTWSEPCSGIRVVGSPLDLSVPVCRPISIQLNVAESTFRADVRMLRAFVCRRSTGETTDVAIRREGDYLTLGTVLEEEGLDAVLLDTGRFQYSSIRDVGVGVVRPVEWIAGGTIEVELDADDDVDRLEVRFEVDEVPVVLHAGVRRRGTNDRKTGPLGPMPLGSNRIVISRISGAGSRDSAHNLVVTREGALVRLVR